MNFDCKNTIIRHRIFKKCYNEIDKEETNRIFCRHDMGHFLDVARLMMILNVKEDLKISDDMIYATALLHDIGRHIQYRQGIGHEISSAQIAPLILDDCDFTVEEKNQIIEAILKHRDSKTSEEKNLNGLLYRADKMSRACFCCQVEPICNWKDEKKNLKLKY